MRRSWTGPNADGKSAGEVIFNCALFRYFGSTDFGERLRWVGDDWHPEEVATLTSRLFVFLFIFVCLHASLLTLGQINQGGAFSHRAQSRRYRPRFLSPAHFHAKGLSEYCGFRFGCYYPLSCRKTCVHQSLLPPALQLRIDAGAGCKGL